MSLIYLGTFIGILSLIYKTNLPYIIYAYPKVIILASLTLSKVNAFKFLVKVCCQYETILQQREEKSCYFI